MDLNLKTALTVFGICCGMTVYSPIYGATGKPVILSLHDAVYLSLRDNPDLRSAELDRITQKFDLLVAENDFHPQYALSGTATHNFISRSDGDLVNSSTTYNATPSVSLKNRYGTNFTLSMSNSATLHGNYLPGLTFSISQPLIKGFGRAVVERALNNAREAEIVNRLTLEDTIKNTINNVVNAYLDVVEQQEKIIIDKIALENYRRTEHQIELLIKAGRKARNDIVQAKSSIAKQQSTIETDNNGLRTKKLTLFNELGLEPEANVIIPEKIKFGNIITDLQMSQPIQSIKKIKQLALDSSLSYQTQKHTLNNLRRAIIVAKDNKRWTVNLTATMTRGPGGATTEQDKGLEAVFANNRTHAESVGVNFTVPIHDMSLEQGLLNAEIALEKAMISFHQSRKTFENDAITSFDNLKSSQKQLEFAKQALQYQKQAVEIVRLKHTAGLVSGFELLTEQQKLNEDEQSLNSSMISYIKNLTDFDYKIGITLKQWNISLRND